MSKPEGHGRKIDLSRLPWIFPGVPLKINGASGNIQGNLTALPLHKQGKAYFCIDEGHLINVETAGEILATQGTMTSVVPFVNTLRPRQNGRHFPDDIFKRILLNEHV